MSFLFAFMSKMVVVNMLLFRIVFLLCLVDYARGTYCEVKGTVGCLYVGSRRVKYRVELWEADPRYDDFVARTHVSRTGDFSVSGHCSDGPFDWDLELYVKMYHTCTSDGSCQLSLCLVDYAQGLFCEAEGLLNCRFSESRPVEYRVELWEADPSYDDFVKNVEVTQAGHYYVIGYCDDGPFDRDPEPYVKVYHTCTSDGSCRMLKSAEGSDFQSYDDMYNRGERVDQSECQS
ncbi:unnamed protein product [Bursaphelenchus okinawaensis]|uniref:Uncharacterized protein n=1 Tax=Bursaphelenchus okinawaensis TaxID=465554 RepID=A0A811KLZ4_9BILA|nr:unnamed protein product [Bursaphelenchus okinawaensis]CAG9107353.1 unnamed protein product [Bursaphelenchus okinawaensis]